MVYDFTEYAYTNNTFYESIIHYGNSREIDEIIEKNNKNHYLHYHNGIYSYLMDASELPEQGWKIHVSATDQNALDILNDVVPYLVHRQVPFKVVRNIETYRLLSQKPFSRAQYGKFITIYPSSPEHCLELLTGLYGLIQEYDGPRVLTDRRYKDCKVLYYRYGGIHPKCEYDNHGMMHTYIKDGLGNTVEDIRRPYYSLPAGITDIVAPVKTSACSYLFTEYDVENAIRFTNSGGAYVAVHRKTGEKVLIKEARPYTVLDGNGHDAIYFREKETEILNELFSSGYVPRVVDAFYEEGHYFLVEEYIEGHTLFHYIVEKNPILRLESAKKLSDYLLQILDYMDQLSNFLLLLHEKGYVLHDLTPDNIMISENNRIKIIDLEGCTSIEQRANIMGKTIYETLLESDYPDLCELGMILFTSLIKKDDLLPLKSDTVKVFLDHIQKYYILPQKLVELTQMLTNSPQQPSIHEIKDDIRQIQRQISAGEIKRRSVYDIDSGIDYRQIIDANVSAVLKFRNKVNGFMYPITPVISNELNITNGFVGIAKALNQLGCTALNDSCAAICKAVPNNIPSGLYVGSAGCVWTLLEQNEVDAAERLYCEKCLSLYDEHDYSLYCGKSGIGLISIMLYYCTGKKRYLNDAVLIGDELLSSYNADHNPYIGYKAGNTGISLFLLHLSIASRNPKYLDFGLSILKIDMKLQKQQDGSEHICFPGTVDGKIVYPYFMEGTAGILCVLLRYCAIINDEELKATAVMLADGLHYGFSVSATLFYGMAGIGNALLDCAYYLSDEKYKLWASEIAEGCMRHAVDHKEYGIVFPDVYNRKISVDYGNGGLGVILFFDRYVNNNKCNFAIPLDEHFLQTIKEKE